MRHICGIIADVAYIWAYNIILIICVYSGEYYTALFVQVTITMISGATTHRLGFGLWGLFGLLISTVSQTDQTHFTNWVWYFQSSFFLLQALHIYASSHDYELQNTHGESVKRLMVTLDVIILPVVFINTFSVLILSTYIWITGSQVFERYETDYGEAKVHAGNILLHAMPFVAACLYAALFYQELKPVFRGRDGGIYSTVVTIAAAFAFPTFYRVFYDPVMVYETAASEQEILTASSLSVYSGMVLWLVVAP